MGSYIGYCSGIKRNPAGEKPVKKQNPGTLAPEFKSCGDVAGISCRSAWPRLQPLL
jgi:hypothetical protein